MNKPAPYPADTRAKGWRFEIDHERIDQSDTWALAKPELRPWLLMLWMVAWKQTPCGALPDDDELIAARMGMPMAEFEANRRVILRGWWKADDGRLYHPVMIERVLEMLAKRSNDRARTAKSRAKTHTNVTSDTAVSNTKVTPESDPSSPPTTRTRTRTENLSTTEPGGSVARGSFRAPESEKTADLSGSQASEPLPPSHTQENPTAAGFAPLAGYSQALGQLTTDEVGENDDLNPGKACKIMRAAGLASTNPGHPLLLELLKAGVTGPELHQAAEKAVAKGAGMAYALSVVQGQRREAAAAAQALPPPATVRPQMLSKHGEQTRVNAEAAKKLLFGGQ